MAFTDRLHNRGSISTGYDIDYSCKFEQDNSESMTRTATQSQGGNRKTWTWSGWIKRTELGRHMYLFSAGGTGFQILGSDNIRFALYYNNTSYYLDLNAKLRDTSAWYHIVGQLDTTQSTAQDRVKVYINGVRQTSFDNDSAHNIPQNADVQHLNEATGTSTGWMKICDWYASGRFFSGYAAEWHFTDGVANDPTEFGEFDITSGIWKPKEYDGSYGTNGFYLDFADGADLGDDESGNGNDFSEGNLTAADQATDTPTNNFCTWFPLWTFPIGRTISEGGTNVDGASAWGGCKGTIGVTNGKWYWENKASGNDTIIGWQTDNCIPESNENSMHNIKDTIGFYQDGNNVWIRDETSGRTDSTTTGTNVSGQIIGMALDLDSSPQTATFYRNGSAISSAINIDGLTGKTIFPFMSQYNQNAESNFGGFCTYTISSAATDENGYGTFEYAPPSGYYALCTKNLAEYG